MTVQANSVIEALAQGAGVTYVDLFAPFKGADDALGPTPLLAADGVHPSQAGHQKIADALAAAGYALLLLRS